MKDIENFQSSTKKIRKVRLATLLERVGLKKISSRVIQFLKYKKWCSKCSVVGGDSVFRECYQSTVIM